MIELINVTKTFQNTCAVHDVSAVIQEGIEAASGPCAQWRRSGPPPPSPGSNFSLSQLNSSSVQAQLKAAGIDTGSKQYQAVIQSMSAAGNGAGYTNIQAIKNRMSRYDKDGDYICPVTGLAGLVVTEKNRAEKNRIIPIPESSRDEKIGRAHV